MEQADEITLRGELSRLAAIVSVQNEIAAGGPDLARVARVVIERSRELTGAEGASLESLEAGAVVCYACVGIIAGLEGLRLDLDATLSGLCVRSGEALRCDDTVDDPRVDAELAARLGIRSLIVVPLSRGGDDVGVLKVVSSRPHAFADADVETLRLLSTLVAAGLAQAAALDALQASEERLRTLVEELGVILWQAEPYSQQPAFVSRSAETILGYPASTWVSEPGFWRARLDPDDRDETLAAATAAIAEGRDHELEYRLRAADGEYRVFRDIVRVLTDESGQAVQIQGVMVDITDRRRLEEQLRESQKMEAVGRLAGGIAHDFNNLLTAIQGYAELLQHRLPAGGVERGYAEEIRSAAQEAASLTRRLLAVGRRQLLNPEELPLNSVVERTESLLRRLAGERVELRTDLSPDAGHVRADPGQLEQVIVSLVDNARDAMPRGGVLTLRTLRVELDEREAEELELTPGRYAVLAVGDTGTGIDEAVLPHVFEPFFTTKELARGTGLGLASAHGIVRQSGGSISVQSAPGAGTTVEIYLPWVELPRHAPAKTAASPAPAAATVLVVEDEPVVRELVTEMLATAGYRVLAAGSGREALAAFDADGDVDLLLSDVVMPSMTGPELARQIRERRPDVRVVYMSAYSDEAVTGHGALELGDGFLAKPFSRDLLVETIGSALGRTGRPGD
jgi:PAS domain S-box-containing protein